MAKRHGAVLVFKEGVTPSKAASALKKIADVLDLPKESFRTVEVGRNRNGQRRVAFRPAPFKMADKVHEFDDEYGGPVWYIP